MLSNNEARYVSTLHFYYMPAPELLSIVPSRGPVYGGTKVTIFGRGFLGSLDHLALFGSSVVPLKVLSATRLEAYTPPSRTMGAGVVAVSTSNRPRHSGAARVDSVGTVAFAFDAPLQRTLLDDE